MHLYNDQLVHNGVLFAPSVLACDNDNDNMTMTMTIFIQNCNTFKGLHLKSYMYI